ncbi:TPA: phage tail protein, partial [Escherichia coli]|nr:phage tail protein [Escherichia coli]EBC8152277.1 phage tail protein [Salmonella enterica]ECK8880573.1 phage tail protein [Salmonella enterica subsp. enterica]HAJ7333671.1 phage tail protein [Escherichia coli UCI 52]EAA1823540.1 phage tail protein [Escherichia coli]
IDKHSAVAFLGNCPAMPLLQQS